MGKTQRSETTFGIHRRERLAIKIQFVAEIPPMLPATVEMIRGLSDIPLALVTSSTRSEMRAVLSSGGLEAYFSVVVCKDDVTKTKPDPEPYLMAIRELRVSGGIAFEDSASGQMSAKAAGLKVIAVDSAAKLSELVEGALSSDKIEFAR